MRRIPHGGTSGPIDFSRWARPGESQRSCKAFKRALCTGIYPPELKSVNLDFDWSYRRAGRAMLLYLRAVGGVSGAYLLSVFNGWFWGMFHKFQHSTGPEGRLAQTWPTGAMVLWIAILLGVTLVVSFLS